MIMIMRWSNNQRRILCDAVLLTLVAEFLSMPRKWYSTRYSVEWDELIYRRGRLHRWSWYHQNCAMASSTWREWYLALDRLSTRLPEPKTSLPPLLSTLLPTLSSSFLPFLSLFFLVPHSYLTRFSARSHLFPKRCFFMVVGFYGLRGFPSNSVDISHIYIV